MPAQSIAQQQAMGIAHAGQQGKIRIKPNTPSANIASSMKPSDVKDFASTSHKGLPNQAENFKFYTVLTPQSYEQKPQELVQQHTPFSFSQAGHQPEMVHSFHMEEEPAMGCAYDMVKELYEAATALEEKKEMVSDNSIFENKIKEIDLLQEIEKKYTATTTLMRGIMVMQKLFDNLNLDILDETKQARLIATKTLQ
jgi:hypothetical protein